MNGAELLYIYNYIFSFEIFTDYSSLLFCGNGSYVTTQLHKLLPIKSTSKVIITLITFYFLFFNISLSYPFCYIPIS